MLPGAGRSGLQAVTRDGGSRQRYDLRPATETVIVVHTAVPFDPARLDEAMGLVEDLVAQSRSEPGTVSYHAATDTGEDGLVRFFEQYEDDAAMETHRESEAYRRLVAALPDLADGEIEIVRFRTDDVERSTLSPAEAAARVE